MKVINFLKKWRAVFLSSGILMLPTIYYITLLIYLSDKETILTQVLTATLTMILVIIVFRRAWKLDKERQEDERFSD